MRGRGSRLLRLALPALIFLAGTAPVEGQTQPRSDGLPALAVAPIVSSDLVQPLYVTHAGDGSGRLFIVEQGGRIRLLSQGTLQSTPFLDISDLVLAGGERGLLGLAFHPDYARQTTRFALFDKLDALNVHC